MAKNTNQLSTDYTLVQLFEVFDNQGNLTQAFDNKIIVNDNPLTHIELTELINKATVLADEPASASSEDAA